VRESASAESYGQPPQNPHIERALLGAILLDNDSLRIVENGVVGMDFFVIAHRKIFAAMQKLAACGQPVELLTLCDALNADPDVAAAGGSAYLAGLIDGLHRRAPVAHWTRIVRNASVRRQIAYAGESLMRSALEPNAEAGELVERLQALARTHTDPFTFGKTSLIALTAEALLARDIKPRQMLLDPILPEQGLVMLYAYRGIGKTFIALGIAAAVSSGGPFLRWKAPRPRKVLYVDGELPASTLKERVAKVLAGMEGPEPESGVLQFVTPDLQDRPMPDLSTIEGQRLLEPLLAEVELIVLDNLSALCRCGSENDGEDWAPVQEWTLGLRRRGKSVLLIHHAGKNKSQRGTSRREDLLDTVITLKHPADYSANEGLRCELHFEKTRSMLSDAAKPFDVKLETGLGGSAVWTCRDLEHIKAEQAAELFAGNMSVRDVAEELGISKSTAQRLRARWKAGQNKASSQGPNPEDVGPRDTGNYED
jgi:hypothetical protein